MIIGTESLNSLFEKNNNTAHLNFKGRCRSCACNVEVKITKTSEGFGFNGGAVCELGQQKLLVQCISCFNSTKVYKNSLTDAA